MLFLSRWTTDEVSMYHPLGRVLRPILLLMLSSAAKASAFGADVTVNDAPSQQYASLQSSGCHSIACSGPAVHVAWIDDRTGLLSVWYSRSLDAGISFSPNLNLSSSLGTCRNATINVAQKGS